jgi:hypothetical protein
LAKYQDTISTYENLKPFYIPITNPLRKNQEYNPFTIASNIKYLGINPRR